MPTSSTGTLKALHAYLRRPEADASRALQAAARAETQRRGVFKKVKAGVKRLGTYERLRGQLAELMCDRRTGGLKPWARELADGDLRDLAVAILAIACSQLNVVVSVAVPFAALVAKRGLRGICRFGKRQQPGRKRSHGR
jgi:hypothetical protein